MEIRLGKYKHYKGKEYEVVAVARHSETLEELVVYKALYETKDFGYGAVWVRPKEMFFETVTKGGKEYKRFEYII